MVEFLLLQLTAKNMVPEKRDPVVSPTRFARTCIRSRSISGFTHWQQTSRIFTWTAVADIPRRSHGSTNEAGQREHPTSSPGRPSSVGPLQCSCARTSSGNARSPDPLELVITKIDDDATTPKKQSIEAFAESIRHHERNVVWSYEECNGSTEDGDDNRVPLGMAHVTSRLSRSFRHWHTHTIARTVAEDNLELGNVVPCTAYCVSILPDIPLHFVIA